MRKLHLLLLVTSAFFFFLDGVSQADFMMKLVTSEGASVTIADNGEGDSDPLTGRILYSKPLGLWNLNVSTGVGSLYFSSETLDLNSSVGSSGASTISIYISENELTTPRQGWTLAVGGGLPAGGSALFDAYYDQDNGLWGGAGLAHLAFPALPGSQNFGGSATGDAAPDNMYSLTLKAEVTHTGSSVTTSFNALLTPVPVPVPPTLILLGTGLAGVIFTGRKKTLP